jgi:hypothetical protein
MANVTSLKSSIGALASAGECLYGKRREECACRAENSIGLAARFPFRPPEGAVEVTCESHIADTNRDGGESRGGARHERERTTGIEPATLSLKSVECRMLRTIPQS